VHAGQDRLGQDYLLNRLYYRHLYLLRVAVTFINVY
jgi:hypothetical protein